MTKVINQLDSSIGIILVVVFGLLLMWIIFNNWGINNTANFINVDYNNVDYTKDRVFYLPALVSGINT